MLIGFYPVAWAFVMGQDSILLTTELCVSSLLAVAQLGNKDPTDRQTSVSLEDDREYTWPCIRRRSATERASLAARKLATCAP